MKIVKRFGLLCLIIGISGLALADSLPMPGNSSKPLRVPSPPRIDATSYILVDADSGKVIAEKNADKPLPPASLTKIMTMYVASQALADGRTNLNDVVTVSTKAWKMGGSRMFIQQGKQVSVKELVKGVIITSGNDASVALAEHIAGGEDAFVDIMNQQAENLGMTNSHFTDVSGIGGENHISSARDMAIVARAVIKEFPQFYPWYSMKSLTYNGIHQSNRNNLLWRDKTVDGLKTGHTSSAGYCLVASAKRDGMRLISVVMGAPTTQERNEDSAQLLNYGFRFYETHKLYEANQSFTEARVWQGKSKRLPIGLEQALYVTVPKGQYDDLKLSANLAEKLKAPINKGQVVGKLTVTLGDEVVAERTLTALTGDQRGGLLRRVSDHISFTWHKLFGSNKSV